MISIIGFGTLLGVLVAVPVFILYCMIAQMLECYLYNVSNKRVDVSLYPKGLLDDLTSCDDLNVAMSFGYLILGMFMLGFVIVGLSHGSAFYYVPEVVGWLWVVSPFVGQVVVFLGTLYAAHKLLQLTFGIWNKLDAHVADKDAHK